MAAGRGTYHRAVCRSAAAGAFRERAPGPSGRKGYVPGFLQSQQEKAMQTITWLDSVPLAVCPAMTTTAPCSVGARREVRSWWSWSW